MESIRERAFDHREFTEDEKKVLQIIEEELDAKYISNLWVRKICDGFSRKTVGYELELSLNNLDKPMYITYMGDDKVRFFELVRKQIREDNIPSRVMYTYGLRMETVKDC